ncbi:MAG: HEAT repeat domain-containing protein [Opitutaceae bacterium]|jgi:HEAT repeat protein
MSEYDVRYIRELRSSEELADCFLRQRYETDDGIHAIATLHYRGGRTEFDLGRRHVESADAGERAVGADILSQLGWQKKTFLDESVDLLIPLLKDSEAVVIRSAAIALGHRKDPRAIPPLLPLINHPDPEVRYGAVAGLSGHDHPDAVAGLIQLSRDSDDTTRDWATFGLGSQTELDTPALRDALVARLADLDPEIRGEAMIGLARRGDERARPAIEAEFRGPFHGDWSLEAAELLACREWIPLLEAQAKTLAPEEGAAFARAFESALAACRQR